MLDTVSESGEKTAQTLVGGLLSPIHGVTPQNCLGLMMNSTYGCPLSVYHVWGIAKGSDSASSLTAENKKGSKIVKT